MQMMKTFFNRISIRAMNYELEQSLALEVHTIIKMFEGERDLKIDQVNTNMRVAMERFYMTRKMVARTEVGDSMHYQQRIISLPR